MKTILGTSGDDWLTGSASDDRIAALQGNDVLVGNGGNNTLLGGDGDDYLAGGGYKGNSRGVGGKDWLSGGEGADSLDGGNGPDTLIGGIGDDTLVGGGGYDRLYGGAGDDQYSLNYDGQIIERPDGGVDVLFARFGYARQLPPNVENITVIRGRAEGNSADNMIVGGRFHNLLVGWRGDDRLYGAEGPDDLTGAAGDDTLDGGSGQDELFGSAGADVLRGGAGWDQLTGGAGADFFVFNTKLILRGRTTHDMIHDFNPIDDTIRLDNDVFSALDQGKLPSGAFQFGNDMVSASEPDDRFLYDTLTGDLYYDADGVGGVSAIKFAQLINMPEVSAADFFIGP